MSTSRHLYPTHSSKLAYKLAHFSIDIWVHCPCLSSSLIVWFTHVLRAQAHYTLVPLPVPVAFACNGVCNLIQTQPRVTTPSCHSSAHLATISMFRVHYVRSNFRRTLLYTNFLNKCLRNKQFDLIHYILVHYNVSQYLCDLNYCILWWNPYRQ